MKQSTVVLCDDSQEVATIFELGLEPEGIAVVWLKDGKSLLDYLKQNPAPALVVLDLKMPRMGGQEFLDIRKDDPQLAPIPVMLLSGSIDMELIGKNYDVKLCLSKLKVGYDVFEFIKGLIAEGRDAHQD